MKDTTHTKDLGIITAHITNGMAAARLSTARFTTAHSTVSTVASQLGEPSQVEQQLFLSYI